MDTAHEAKKLIALLLHLMDHNQTDQQLMRYVFTRIEEVLGLGDDYADVDAYGAKHAHYFTLDGKKLIFWPFLFAIKTTDKYIQKSASCGFACLLSNENVEGGELELVEWILDKLREVRSGEWEVALDTLYIISRSISARKALMNKGAVEFIATILKKLGTTGNAQHIYELVFVLWSLSLGITDYSDFLKSGVINTLVDLIAAAPSRKVTRMSLATLKNLAEKEQCEVLDEILSAGLLKNIENIVNSNSLKYAGDIEFEFDVKLLHEILLRNFRELSRFDRWSAEINLGSLRLDNNHFLSIIIFSQLLLFIWLLLLLRNYYS